MSASVSTDDQEEGKNTKTPELLICEECKKSQNNSLDKFCSGCGTKYKISNLIFQNPKSFQEIIKGGINAGVLIYQRLGSKKVIYEKTLEEFKSDHKISNINNNNMLFNYRNRNYGFNFGKKLIYFVGCYFWSKINFRFDLSTRELIKLSKVEDIFDNSFPLLDLCEISNISTNGQPQYVELKTLLIKFIENKISNPVCGLSNLYGETNISCEILDKYCSQTDQSVVNEKSKLIIILREINDDYWNNLKSLINIHNSKQTQTNQKLDVEYIRKNHDEENLKYKKNLNSALSQLPDIFYYNPNKKEFYDEKELKEILKIFWDPIDWKKDAEDFKIYIDSEDDNKKQTFKTIKIMKKEVQDLIDVVEFGKKLENVKKFFNKSKKGFDLAVMFDTSIHHESGIAVFK